MNDGILTGITKPVWRQWYPQLHTVSTDGTGLVQPINIDEPGRNNGFWTYLDANTVVCLFHLNHSYFNPEGTGQAYVVELPVKARRWGGKSNITSPQIIGGGRFIDFFHNPYSEHLVVASLSDQSWFNMKGDADKYLQVYVQNSLRMGTGTWTGGTASKTITHNLPFKPDPTDINFKLTSLLGSCTNIIGNVASGSAPTATAARFSAMYAASAAAATTATGAAAQIVMPCAATLDNLYVDVDTAPGAGLTRTWDITVNGTPSTVSAAMVDPATTANDTTHSIAVVAGDVVSIRTTASGVTAGAGAIRWTVRATCAPNTSFILGGTIGGLSASATNYVAVQSFNLDAASGNVECIMPTAGTIKNAYVALAGTAGAGGSGKSYTFTLYQNGNPTSLVVTISELATTGNDTNAAHAVTVAAGDKLYWQSVPTNTPNSRAAFFGVEFDPTTNGESVHMFGGPSNLVNSAARWNYVTQGALTWSATETQRQVLTQAATWQKFYVYTPSGTGGAGKTYQFQLSKNTTAGNPSVTINNTTTGNDTSNTLATAVADRMSMKVTPTGTPTAGLVEYGLVSTMVYTGVDNYPLLVNNITSTTFDVATALGSNLSASDVTYSWRAREEPNFTNGGAGTYLYSPLRPLIANFPMELLVRLVYEVDN